MTTLLAPAAGEAVSLSTPFQLRYDELKGDAKNESEDYLHLKTSGSEDASVPQPVRFRWNTDSEESLLEISDREDFDAPVFSRWIRGTSAEVYNLFIGREYFWRVNKSAASRFLTLRQDVRWCRVPGCSNVRDIGSLCAADGRPLKQGLCYRGTEMDTHHTITAEGIRVMREELHVRTDLDLREEVVGLRTESPLGKDVGFQLIPCFAYQYFLADEQKPACKALFDVLSDEANYPIYFHCWGGADRTGTLALMLEAVLGCSDEELCRDYERTGLSIWGDRRCDGSGAPEGEWFPAFAKAILAYGPEDASLRERCLAFLLSCGVTEEQMARIRRIFSAERDFSHSEFRV